VRLSTVVPVVLAAATLATSVRLAAAEPAFAPPGLTQPAPTPPPAAERAWYGWQILAIDALSLGALYIASTDRADFMGYVGVTGLAVSGPIIHAVHDRPGRAVGSLVLRPGLTIGGALAGYYSVGTCHDYDCLAGFVVGGFLGGVSAEVIDSFVLAWEPRVPVTPVVTPTSGGATVGLAGAF